jgi:acyl-CoA reductase-like NAD-dependent aldehyde dehydrogenase
MTIDGASTGAVETFGVVDPSTGAEFARAPECTRDQLDAAMTAATRAGRPWRADEAGRIAGLRAAADALDAHTEELAGLLCAEQGKPLGAARYEVSETARWLRAAAGLELARELVLSDGAAHGLVADALTQGAAAAAGGAPIEGPGYFFSPTILTGAREGMRIVDEEQFGPAVPVLTYRDLDEAIERANATPFGLSGSVWSSDVERATAVAEELDCGTAFVNDHLALSPELPFGGSKESGLGVENGHWGLEEFTQLQVVHRPAV